MAAETLSCVASPSRWAVIVGVDAYSNNNPEQNLRGCCNDAILMHDFLCNSLKVPQKNVRLHLARSKASPAATPDPPSTDATYWNFRESLDHVISHAKPGDFVHIHFSGHGNREPTLLPEEKGESSRDERLCFTDNEMPDHEFGAKLDEMTAAPKGLVVLVTLDCCFSGGAERWGEGYAIRCKPRNNKEPIGSSVVGLQHGSEHDHSSRSARNASLNKGWLYREREYNVIAACQPNERSVEGPTESGPVHGAFTSILVSRLASLGYRQSTTTYAIFQSLLEATMKGTLSHFTNQQPMLLGPRNRVLFESFTHHGSPSYIYVLDVKGGCIVVDKGRVSGVGLGDVYHLSDPRKSLSNLDDSGSADVCPSEDAIKVIIAEVRDYDSDAKIWESTGMTASPDRLETISSGWLAELVKEAKNTYALIYHDGTETSTTVAKGLQGESQCFIDAARPIVLQFPDKTRQLGEDFQPDFHVRIFDGVLEVRNSEDEPFPHLPTIPANRYVTISSIDVAQRLMYVLWHMQSFLRLLEKKPLDDLNSPPGPFTLTFIEIDPPAESLDIISSWEINFRNDSSRSLFITVFNLTPLHGVSQIMPSGEGHGKEVLPRENVPVIIDIDVPKALAKLYQEDASFVMRDVLKIFVTTEHTDLHHYELEDLVGDSAPSNRHVIARPQPTEPRASWWLEEREIVTRSRLG